MSLKLFTLIKNWDLLYSNHKAALFAIDGMRSQLSDHAGATLVFVFTCLFRIKELIYHIQNEQNTLVLCTC